MVFFRDNITDEIWVSLYNKDKLRGALQLKMMRD